MGLKTLLVTQARIGSSRLPGKVLKEVGGKTLLQIHLERLKKCLKVDEIIVATTVNDEDEIIYNNALKWGFKSFRGSELNVLDRFYQSVKDKNADWIVRVTSDCPLLDSKLVDTIIEYAQNHSYDYVSNGLVEHFPDGQDVEVFKFRQLPIVWKYPVLNHFCSFIALFVPVRTKNKFFRWSREIMLIGIGKKMI